MQSIYVNGTVSAGKDIGPDARLYIAWQDAIKRFEETKGRRPYVTSGRTTFEVTFLDYSVTWHLTETLPYDEDNDVSALQA